MFNVQFFYLPICRKRLNLKFSKLKAIKNKPRKENVCVATSKLKNVKKCNKLADSGSNIRYCFCM